MPKCDPAVSQKLLLTALAVGIDLEGLIERDREYSMTCQPNSVLDLFTGIASVKGETGPEGPKGDIGAKGVQVRCIRISESIRLLYSR